MNQEVSGGDIVIGVIVLAIFLAAAFGAGRLLSRFKDGRFSAAWGPLVPLIGGTVAGDGGGAATSWLSGTYRGAQVRASMVPDRNRYQDNSGQRYNYFDVALLEIPGRQDWSILFHTQVMGLGQSGWQISAADAALEERLRAQNVLDLLERLGPSGLPRQAPLEYSARSGTLLYREDAGGQWIPTPQRFQETLDVLLALAAINAQVNPA